MKCRLIAAALVAALFMTPVAQAGTARELLENCRTWIALDSTNDPAANPTIAMSCLSYLRGVIDAAGIYENEVQVRRHAHPAQLTTRDAVKAVIVQLEMLSVEESEAFDKTSQIAATLIALERAFPLSKSSP